MCDWTHHVLMWHSFTPDDGTSSPHECLNPLRLLSRSRHYMRFAVVGGVGLVAFAHGAVAHRVSRGHGTRPLTRRPPRHEAYATNARRPRQLHEFFVVDDSSGASHSMTPAGAARRAEARRRSERRRRGARPEAPAVSAARRAHRMGPSHAQCHRPLQLHTQNAGWWALLANRNSLRRHGGPRTHRPPTPRPHAALSPVLQLAHPGQEPQVGSPGQTAPADESRVSESEIPLIRERVQSEDRSIASARHPTPRPPRT